MYFSLNTFFFFFTCTASRFGSVSMHWNLQMKHRGYSTNCPDAGLVCPLALYSFVFGACFRLFRVVFTPNKPRCGLPGTGESVLVVTWPNKQNQSRKRLEHAWREHALSGKRVTFLWYYNDRVDCRRIKPGSSPALTLPVCWWIVFGCVCNALRGLPPSVERHLRDWCTLFSSGKEQVHLRSRERSPAPCTGQLWVARGRWRGRERKSREEGWTVEKR